MKQGWVIEQESKWTLVETQQQRENSRLEHSPPPTTFPFPLHFKHWSWTVLAACLLVWPIHVAKCNVGPTSARPGYPKMQLKHDTAMRSV